MSTACEPVTNSQDLTCTTIPGVDVTINCSVTANPLATLQVVADQQDNVVVMNDGNTEALITIDDVVEDNFRVYECIANNTLVGAESRQRIRIELSLYGKSSFLSCHT